MAEPVYLHFSITNMITIIIMVLIGAAIAGIASKALKKNQSA